MEGSPACYQRGSEFRALHSGAHRAICPVAGLSLPGPQFPGAKMADPKNTLDVVAQTHAFTVTLVTARQDSLGTGKVTKVREGGPTTVKGLGTKQLPCAEGSAR